MSLGHFSNEFSHQHKKKVQFQEDHKGGRATIEDSRLVIQQLNDQSMNEMKKTKSKEIMASLTLNNANINDMTHLILCLQCVHVGAIAHAPNTNCLVT